MPTMVWRAQVELVHTWTPTASPWWVTDPPVSFTGAQCPGYALMTLIVVAVDRVDSQPDGSIA
jgi:hypothetical protein